MSFFMAGWSDSSLMKRLCLGAARWTCSSFCPPPTPAFGVGEQLLASAMALRGPLLLGSHHALDQRLHLVEHFVAALFDRARDDERRAGLVDEHRVHLVHDRVVEPALHAVLGPHRHVVAQVVEAELVVRAVGDVAGVLLAPLGGLHVLLDAAHGEPEELVDLAHPLAVAPGEVVVDRDQVSALAGQRIQVERQGGDQGLALAGGHLGDLALVAA
jgi:hypothetical protein